VSSTQKKKRKEKKENFDLSFGLFDGSSQRETSRRKKESESFVRNQNRSTKKDLETRQCDVLGFYWVVLLRQVLPSFSFHF